MNKEDKNFNYKRLHPFKWFILENYPFLEDSIDVLTNYQLFCKLGEMYNKEIDAINMLGIQVEGITDWFDDLDVQEEINNKLDEMVEDGTLESILAEYFDTKFDKNGMINIIDYGAKCDGETDDTLAIQEAISHLGETINGVICKTLIIPGKTVVSDKLTIEGTGITIKGYNINSCQILFKNEGSYLEFKNSDNTSMYEVQIRDLYIRGDFSQDFLIVFDKCVNIYLNRVYVNECEAAGYLIKFINGSNIIFINECILDSSEDVANHPAISNGIYLQNQTAIFNFTKNNCWNLNKVIVCNGVCLNNNFQDNWIENCNVFFAHSNTNDLRYCNINFENNTFSAHAYSGYNPTDVRLLDFNENSNTNAWNSNIKIANNNFYFYNIDYLYNHSLINFVNLDPSGTVYISYKNNVYSGKTLSTLTSYVVNIPSGLENTFKFTEIITQAPGDSNYITNNINAICCPMLSPTSDRILSIPKGVYLCNTTTTNKGLIKYDTSSNKFVLGYNGTLENMPKKWTGETIPYPVTSSNYIDAINTIARVINNSGIGVIQST